MVFALQFVLKGESIYMPHKRVELSRDVIDGIEDSAMYDLQLGYRKGWPGTHSQCSYG
jgi:hypothetical protein